MKSTARAIRRFLASEEGPTAVEYAVMISLIILVCFGAIGAVGSQNGGLWSGIVTKLRAVGFLP